MEIIRINKDFLAGWIITGTTGEAPSPPPHQDGLVGKTPSPRTRYRGTSAEEVKLRWAVAERLHGLKQTQHAKSILSRLLSFAPSSSYKYYLKLQ